jgi:hypothetical protein
MWKLRKERFMVWSIHPRGVFLLIFRLERPFLAFIWGVAGAMTGGMLAAATIKPKLFLKML